MPIAPLKLSFAVSVLIHGIVLGGVAWYSRMPRPADLEAPGGVTTIELIAAPAAVAEWFGNVSKRVAARKTLPVGGWARRHFGIHLLAEQIRRIRDRCEDSGWIMQ